MARAYPRRRLAATLGLAFGLLCGPAVHAADYGSFVEVETEEDILDLLSAGDLDTSEAETLIELLEQGVNLDSADRDELYALPNLTYADVDAILAYRDEAGGISDPLALVASGALEERKLLAIAPFLVVELREPDLFATRGRVRYRTTYVAGDEQVPSMWLGAKVSTFRNLDVGLYGVLTRKRLGEVSYDPNRDALSAEGPGVRVHAPKFYVQWDTKTWQLLAGTYRIGFGQRLTFDNTTQVTPNGIRLDETLNYSQDLSRSCRLVQGDELDSGPCLGEYRYEYESPDYRWTDRLRGAAVGLKKLEAGPGWFQMYGFFSYQTHSIYQYELYDKRRCDDPRDDDDPDCKAPAVYLRKPDRLEATPRLAYSTLPDMFNTLLGGGNLSYFFDRRTHVGVTGYGADVSWLIEGMDLDFQEWSRFPYGGAFGAVGLDAAWGRDVIDLFLELARSFDGQPEGGGWAAILRATFTWKKHEFEAAARYYDRNYANPYARPISAADEYDGLRARDEAGLRLKYTGQVGDLELRATADFWAQMSVEAPKALLTARASYEVEPWFKPMLFFEFGDKDLSDSGHGNCYEVAPNDPSTDEPAYCKGEKIQFGTQLRFVPAQGMSLTARYQHRFVDDGRADFATSFRQDSSAWLTWMYKPVENLRLRLRVRYLFEDLTTDRYLEHSVWGYVELSYMHAKTFGFKARYEVYALLDNRDASLQRNPNPAHWLRLELEYRF
jgi:hypothetical protein